MTPAGAKELIRSRDGGDVGVSEQSFWKEGRLPLLDLHGGKAFPAYTKKNTKSSVFGVGCSPLATETRPTQLISGEWYFLDHKHWFST